MALPGLQRLSGWAKLRLPEVPAELVETVKGQADWTQFVHGRLELRDQTLVFIPTWKEASRLSSMAYSNAVVMIPEGETQLMAGKQVIAQQMS